MNKEDLIKDLNTLSAQKLQIEGAMNYIANKLKALDDLEKEEEK